VRKRPTVTIGIPAYNEEANIKTLLEKLLAQKQKNFHLLEIVVISDGSTDKTVKIIKSFRNPKIRFINRKERLGQQICQNQILNLFKGQILVIIEADTLPFNEITIGELVKPFINNRLKNLGMTVGTSLSTNPVNLYQEIMNRGGEIKSKLFDEWRGGDNLYCTGGHAMKALSRRFANFLEWPKDVPEDSYVYLRLKELGLKLVIQRNAKVYKNNVNNVIDRRKQARKFLSGIESLKNYFPKEVVDKEYNPPTSLLLKHIFLAFIDKPVLTTLWLLETLLNRISFLTTNKKNYNPLYSPYDSSKELRLTCPNA